MKQKITALLKSRDLFFKHALMAEDKGDNEKAQRFLDKAVTKEDAAHTLHKQVPDLEIIY